MSFEKTLCRKDIENNNWSFYFERISLIII